jgi:mono/diheme cytochrome c family protein
MAVIAFALFWVVLGVGLFFIAISGGPGGARERLHTQSRRGRKGAYLAFAVVFILFGIAVPIAASLGVRHDRDEIPQANISSLTAGQEHGRKIFSEYCRLCHTLQAANAVASVGPNLDTLKPTKALVLNAIQNGRARGNGAMAKDLVVGQDAQDVASFVSKAVGNNGK